MPNGGRSANVRSHRRGGGRRGVSPWLVIPIVVVLLLGGVAVGWAHLVRQPCTGMDTATIDASPNITPILQSLAGQWEKTKPAVGGRCVAVTVTAKDSALMATALGSPWDAQANGKAPDVWVPESSVWVREASANITAQELMPDLQPSLARSPSVIAMPRNEAVALGWPNANFDWPDLIKDEATSDFWNARGQDWGDFKFTMTSPETSTAGMLALMAIADTGSTPDGLITEDEQKAVFSWAEQQKAQAGDTSDILTGLAKADTQSATAADKYVSAFPALEQDVLKYNQGDPKQPLVAVYPKSGMYDADHPYLILSGPKWGSTAGVTAAKAFEGYARGPIGRAALLKAGFRDANRAGDAQFVPANGVVTSLNAYLPRPVLVPQSVTDTLQAWTAVTRETNVLLVMDVSGSMVDMVPGTGKKRIELAQAAATSAINEFDGQANVGLWEFATDLDGSKPYKSLATIGPLDETQTDGNSRKDDMIHAINGIVPQGNTGLYATLDAAQKQVVANFKPGATNLVVLITDGKDDTTGSGSPSATDLNQLELDITKNHASSKAVPIVTIGLGPQADDNVLRDISRKTGASSLTSATGFDLNQVLLSALFGADSVD
jgi:Ca-activated chloride channel homolog